MASRMSKNKVGGNYTGARSFDNNDFTHCNSAAIVAITRYSASMEEQATMRCFVELQEIGLAPRKIRKNTCGGTIIWVTSPVYIRETMQCQMIVCKKSDTKESHAINLTNI